jgi:hypothetical protein
MCGFSMFSTPKKGRKGGAEAKDQKFHLLEVTWRKQFSTSKQISFHHNGKSVNQSKSPFCGFSVTKKNGKKTLESLRKTLDLLLSSTASRLVIF